MSEQIDRYSRMSRPDRAGQPVFIMSKNPRGNWVTYADHLARIEQLEAELAVAKRRGWSEWS